MVVMDMDVVDTKTNKKTKTNTKTNTKCFKDPMYFSTAHHRPPPPQAGLILPHWTDLFNLCMCTLR